jgi:hypothetical protein
MRHHCWSHRENPLPTAVLNRHQIAFPCPTSATKHCAWVNGVRWEKGWRCEWMLWWVIGWAAFFRCTMFGATYYTYRFRYGRQAKTVHYYYYYHLYLVHVTSGNKNKRLIRTSCGLLSWGLLGHVTTWTWSGTAAFLRAYSTYRIFICCIGQESPHRLTQ